MTWVIWRQYRIRAAIAAAGLAAFASVLVPAGLQMASQWHSLIAASCTSASRCGGGSLDTLLRQDLAILSMTVPAVLGFLWARR